MTQEMQRALDALLEGRPIPEEARGALSPAERAEIASLSAAAVLARTVLHAAQPSPEAEESSLMGAQRLVRESPPRPAAPPHAGLLGWLTRRRQGKG